MPQPLRPAAIAQFAADLQAGAAARGHRAILVLSGTRQWCREAAEAIGTLLAPPRLVWLGEPPPTLDTLHLATAQQLLGQEIDAVVQDAWAGFDAEAFGALAGSLPAGGLMVLLTPPLMAWRDHADPEHARLAVTPCAPEQVSGRFLQHMADALRGTPGVTLLAQDKPLPVLAEQAAHRWQPLFAAGGVTPEQAEAVAAMQRVAHGHRRRPLVLTSDRGRGKSAALGIGAARLLQQGTRHIIVTAPRQAAVAQLFAHAARLLAGARQEPGRLAWQGRCIEFVPPDALLHSLPATELLLVDEAAAIPTPLLERMVAHYARIVFASTIHGYEGNGRGFALRFQKTLTQRTPGWQALQLKQPVRWAEGDPLERLSFRALMLDAEPVAGSAVAAASRDNSRFEWLPREQLLQQEPQLAELFGLLVLAHYRTRPNDLRQLLDGPNVRLAVLRHHGHIVAAALVAEEGGLPAALAQGIYEGRRRAHGHLLAQSLAVHAGFAEAPVLRAWRVVRIVVHPALQRRRLGHHLLQQLEREACQGEVDYLGASFGGDAPLLAFWQEAGWRPVRVGLTREAASGSHSLMVLHPLSAAGGSLFRALRGRFAEQLPLLLGEPLSELDAPLALALLRGLPAAGEGVLGEQDWRDVRSFAEALRGYEVCLLALWRLAPEALADASLRARLSPCQQQMLVEKVLQRHDWQRLAAAHGLRGRGGALEALREAYRRILEACRETGRFAGA
jgi:tRNA(Met) cytidine acetyltransferase